MIERLLKAFVILAVSVLPISAYGQPYWQIDQGTTRYMALGDSLAAGYGAMPATQGYVYLLYGTGVFDTVPNTLFSNAGVPGATSQHVLDYQVPQAIEAFGPTVITITVGGNDLLSILMGADPFTVLTNFQNNLWGILQALRNDLPEAQIYVSNLYTIPDIPGADAVVQQFNLIVDAVAGSMAVPVPVADVYSAFKDRNGLLLIERHDAGLNVHPTNSGYRVMAQAFEAVIE